MPDSAEQQRTKSEQGTSRKEQEDDVVIFINRSVTETVNSTNGSGRRLEKGLLHHRTSIESLTNWHWQESRVLILYTGGTIGMTVNERGKLVPTPGELEARIRKYPHMHDSKYARDRFSAMANAPLVLPDCREKRRVVYWVHEYSPLLDSSNMTMDDWIRIGKDIKLAYADFDGFVILHGTDTLAYTASALSFMLEHLGKPVVITGSQIPLFETRSDGRDNFIGSLIMAGNYNIPEVTAFFNNKLFRGNRTAKVSSGRLNAFDSPNFAPLATAGISINVEYRNVFRPSTLAKFDVFADLNRDVGLLRIFPSISTETVKSFLQHPMKGAVLQTYGAGNIPSNRGDIVEVMQEASKRGVLIVNITQCMHGTVEAIYETGEALENAGVIMGLDMTPEAALAKLSYVIAKDVDHETKKKMLQTNLRGEMTITRNESDDDGEENHAMDDIVTSIGRALKMASLDDQCHLQEVLIPTLFLNAVQNSDIKRMDQLHEHVVELNQMDAMGTTCLHVAASEGSVEVVKWLLLHGALVHLRDLQGHTPLWHAITCDQVKVIELLVQTGAHITEIPTRVGEALVSAAATNNFKRIDSFIKAGVDISQHDNLGRTALHAACLMGLARMAKHLLARGACTRKQDKTKLTPAMCAQISEYEDIVTLCVSHNRISAH